MRPSHFVEYRFHGIGQGLFSAGTVIQRNTQGEEVVFRWIYDCGTYHSFDQKLLRQAIKFETAKGWARIWYRGERVNLIVLSHFDSDHISGVTALLERNKGVDYLMIPYLTVEQRLGVIASHAARGIRLGRGATQAILDPIAYFSPRVGAAGRIICIVPGEGEAPPPEERPNRDRPYETTIPPRKSSASRSAKVDFVKSGTPMGFIPNWEFLPYEGIDPHPTKAPVSVSSLLLRLRRLSALLISRRSTVARRARALEQIKLQYDRVYGRAQRNPRSLFLWAGPIASSNYGIDYSGIYAVTYRNYQSRRVRWRPLAYDRLRKCSILYTGDGHLKDVDKASGKPKVHGDIARLTNLYGRRMRSVGTLQVMHHGSRHNWSKGVAKILDPHCSVFSSDPSRPPRHPHAEVWRDFSNTVRLQTARGCLLCIQVSFSRVSQR